MWKKHKRDQLTVMRSSGKGGGAVKGWRGERGEGGGGKGGRAVEVEVVRKG